MIETSLYPQITWYYTLKQEFLMYLISSCLKCAILFIFTVDLNQGLEALPSLCFIYLFIFIYVWVHVCATPFI